MRERRLIRAIVLLVGLAALAVPTWCFVVWTIVFLRRDFDQASRVAEFMSYIPQFLPSPSTVTLLALICALVSLFSGMICVRGSQGLLKAMAVMEMFLGAMFACLLLFFLM